MEQQKPRVLKVQEVGDYWKGKTIPRLLLKGDWLHQAGIQPNCYVEVTNPKEGVLIISTPGLEKGG